MPNQSEPVVAIVLESDRKSVPNGLPGHRGSFQEREAGTSLKWWRERLIVASRLLVRGTAGVLPPSPVSDRRSDESHHDHGVLVPDAQLALLARDRLVLVLSRV